MTIKKGPLVAGLALGALGAAWLLPPVLSTARGLCPTRPGPVSQARAVPSFSRKYGISCSQCHTAFPALNEYGRQFRNNGYVREQGESEGVLETKDGLRTEKVFPWGALAKSRPFDQVNSSDREFKFTALSELELFIAGGDAARKFSYFTEVEMEAEKQELTDSAGGEVSGTSAYTPSVGELQFGYHASPYLNVLAANRSFFFMDPYQTLSNMGRLTVSKRLLASEMDNGNLDDAKQTGMVFGEVGREGLGSLYYAAGLTAGRDDPKGRSYKSTAVRLAFDTLRGVMVGAFGNFGAENGPASAPTGNKTRFSKVGVDALVELAGFTGRTALVYNYAKDLSTNARADNRGAYAELFYTFKKDDRPFVVPLVRQDWYQSADGRKEYGALTAQVSNYLRENVRAFVEYRGDTKQDFKVAGDPRLRKDHRWLAQIELGF